jgi:predicted PurR-regulated permease PerM
VSAPKRRSPSHPCLWRRVSLILAPPRACKALFPRCFIRSTGIIIIFVTFILLQREDLRNRLIRLAGSHDLQRATAALDDAARRLSRLFLIQLLLNGTFGVVIGTGLSLIGVPSAILWGILAAVLRFVPYIGAAIAAAFPLVLAVAVDPTWSMLLWTLALFLVVEPIVGHVIEPMVYGHSTGLSPVAVVSHPASRGPKLSLPPMSSGLRQPELRSSV